MVPRYALSGEGDGEDDESFDNEFIGIGDIRRPIQSINQRPDDVDTIDFESFDKYVRWILSPVTDVVLSPPDSTPVLKMQELT